MQNVLLNRIVQIIITVTLFTVAAPTWAQSSGARGEIKDGFIHIGVFGSFAPASYFRFSDYAEGTVGNPTVKRGVARFTSDTFSSYGGELIFYTQPATGFSFGYVIDSKRDIEHMDIDYDDNTSTRTYKTENDTFSNVSYTFNYFIRSPERSYLGLGINYSQPQWIEKTASNKNVTFNGGLGFQFSYGFALVKGVIFDLTLRSTTIKMKYSDPTTNTFQDFGSGSLNIVLVGFKFIL